MKNKISLLKVALGLFAVVSLLYFSSCQKTQVVTTERKQKTVNVQLKDTSNNTDNLSSGYCKFNVALIEAIPGQPKYGCTGIGLCYVDNLIPLSYLMPCPVFKLPDCKKVDCNNPWNFKNIFIEPITDYKDLFYGDPHAKLGIHFVPIAVTSNIAVLQFYEELNGTLNSQTLTLPAHFSLPKEISISLGLSGYTIPAGKYPVVYDAKSKTLNAIVSIK